MTKPTTDPIDRRGPRPARAATLCRPAPPIRCRPTWARRGEPVDCAIIGGGPAGLSAAVYLGRLRRSTWFRRPAPGARSGRRSTATTSASRRRGGRRTAPPGPPPGRAAMAPASTTARLAGAAQRRPVLHRRSARARARSRHRSRRRSEYRGETRGAARPWARKQVRQPRAFYARSLIFATGVHDEFPDFLGRDECVGRTLFWCIICDGYEAIDKRVVVIGHDEEAVSRPCNCASSPTRSPGGRATRLHVPAARLEDLAAAGIESFPYAVVEYPNEEGCLSALAWRSRRARGCRSIWSFVVCAQAPELGPGPGPWRAAGRERLYPGRRRAEDELPGVFAAGDDPPAQPPDQQRRPRRRHGRRRRELLPLWRTTERRSTEST